jgi:ABC-type transport system substrate-binding protein
VNFLPNTSRRTVLVGGLAAGAVATASACSFTGGDTGGGDGDGDDPAVLRVSDFPIPHIDPHMTGAGTPGDQMKQMLWEPLTVTVGADAEAHPGAAESWDVSEDGLTYTFHLRSDATWSNGDPVVADDFVHSWERRLSPDTDRGEYNPEYKESIGIVGAWEFLQGEITDFAEVGVTAVDESTLEFTLSHLNPDLPVLMSTAPSVPLHRATIEENPDSWLEPGVLVTNGQMTLDAFRPNADAVLVKNAEYWDADSVGIDRVEWRFTDAGNSAQMLSFEAGEIDVFRVEGDLASVTTDPAMAERLHTSISGQWRHLTLMGSENDALHDVRVRRALAMAIDREALAEISQPDVSGPSLVPDAVPGYEQVPATAFDVEGAKELLAEAGHPDGEGLPPINICIPFPTAWCEAIAGMWQENLGVTANVDLVELGVYSDKRSDVNPADYVGFAYGNIAYNPPSLFNAGMFWSEVDAEADSRFLLSGQHALDLQAVRDDASLTPGEANARAVEIMEDGAPRGVEGVPGPGRRGLRRDRRGAAQRPAPPGRDCPRGGVHRDPDPVGWVQPDGRRARPGARGPDLHPHVQPEGDHGPGPVISRAPF